MKGSNGRSRQSGASGSALPKRMQQWADMRQRLWLDAESDALTDTLADLMHWAESEGVDFLRCAERAFGHWREETGRNERIGLTDKGAALAASL